MKHAKIVFSVLIAVISSFSILSFTSSAYHEVYIVECHKLNAAGTYVYDPFMPPSGCVGGATYCGFCYIVDQFANGSADGKVTYNEAVVIANANTFQAHNTQVAHGSVAIYKKPI